MNQRLAAWPKINSPSIPSVPPHQTVEKITSGFRQQLSLGLLVVLLLLHLHSHFVSVH
jgi:hypothetical protein